MKIFFLLLISLMVLNLCAAEKIIFSFDGSYIKSLTVKELISKLSTHKVTVMDPVSKDIQKYNTVKLIDTLRLIYGNKWINADHLMIKTKTKYSPRVDISLLTKREGYLAFSRADGKKFKIITRTTKKIVKLDPLFLIWSDTKLKNKKDYRWAYKLTGIDLIKKNEKHVGLYPIGKATGTILRGYKDFNKYCLRCHSLNGIGGTYSSDLLTNASFTNRGRKGIARYIENPNKYNQFSKMPSLKIYLPNTQKRRQLIIDIVNYLEYLNTTTPDDRKRLEHKKKSSNLNDILNN